MATLGRFHLKSHITKIKSNWKFTGLKENALNSTSLSPTSRRFEACGEMWHITVQYAESDEDKLLHIILQSNELERVCYAICVCSLYTTESTRRVRKKMASCSFSHWFERNSVYKRDVFQKSVIRQPQPQMDCNYAILEVSIRISHRVEDLCHLEDDDKALVRHLDLLRSGVARNVTFVVEERHFLAHREVLVSHSKVFERMFENEMSESKTGRIVIMDAKAEIFDLFLQFLYTGGYPKDFEVHAVPLFVLADKYEVKSLEQLCIAHFARMNLDDNSAKVLFGLTRKYPCLERLKTRLVNYVDKNLNFLDSEDWKEVEKEDPEGAIELLRLYAKSNLKK